MRRSGQAPRAVRRDPPPRLPPQGALEWVALGAILIAFAGYVAFELYRSRVDLEAAELTRLEHEANVVEKSLAARLQATSNALDALRAEVPALRPRQDGVSQLNQRMQVMVSSMTGVRTFVLVDADGIAVASNRKELIGIDWHEGERYRAIRSRPDATMLYVSPPFETPLGNWALSLARVVLDGQGGFDGYVLAIIDPEYFNLLLDSTRHAPDVSATLIHGAGTIIYRIPEAKGAVGMSLAAAPDSAFSRHVQSGKDSTTWTTALKTTGQEALVVLRSIRPSRSASSSVLVASFGHETAAVFAPWRKELRDRGTLVVVVALSTVLGLFYRRRRLATTARLQADHEAARRTQEEALQESEQRFRLVLRNAPVSVAAQDRELRYTWAYNQRTARSEDLIGKLDSDIFTAEEAAHVTALKTRVLAENVGHREQMWLNRPSGRIFLDIAFEPIRDGAGRVIGVGSATVDLTPMKLAEEALREREERLAVTLRSIGDAVIATDQAACITVFNGVAEALTGWKAAEAIGRPIQEVFNIVSEETRAPAVNPIDRVLREGVVVGLANHTALIARDGTERPIADSGAPIRGAGGEISGVVLVFRDQTEERRAQQTLRDSEARYRATVEQAAVGVALVDSRTNRFLQVNAGFCAMLGYIADELMAGSWPLITHPDDVDTDRAGVARMQATGVPYRREKRYLRKDGTVLWASVTVSPVLVPGEPLTTQVAVAVDITERVRADEAVQRSEQRLRVLIEKASDMLVVLDADMRVSFWSPSATEQLGWTAQEAIGRPGFELVHPDDRPNSRETFLALLASPGAPARFVRRQLHRDGSSRLVEVIARNLLDDPAVRGVVANLRDITEQRRLTEQFQQAQKLEGIGRLAGGVAHDFNNLLTVILSCSAALRDDLDRGTSASREDVDQIHGAGVRAADLTRQLLAFARKQVVAPVPLDLNEVVRSSQKLLVRLLGEDIELQVRLQPGLWPMRADPGQLEQVILNLAVNARDAIRGGGTITVETRNVSVDAVQETSDPERQGDWVRLLVRDSGVGMSPEVKAHLFEPFFTTKEQGKGTGLGLATVYGVVKQAGGHVHVESQPGQGSAFEVCFPRGQHTPAASPQPAARVTGRGSEQVLVVEDDALVRKITSRALRAGGYQVEVADHPQAALDLSDDQLRGVRLLVTDVVMPGLDGHTLAQRLQQRHPSLRVLYVSGYTQDAITEHGVLGAGIDLLAKPFTGPTLLARVRAILDAEQHEEPTD
jgi:PAS domain S-box-containing protein